MINQRQFFLLFLFFLSFNSYLVGQIIKGVVINSITKEKIQYATIIIKQDRKSGVYTNLDGEFSIDIKKGDSLLISSVGYNDTTLIINSIEDPPLIFQLTPEFKILPEVIVQNKSPIIKELGFCKLRRDINAFPGSKGGIIIVHISNSETSYHEITNLIYELHEYKSIDKRNGPGVVRIRLYDCDSKTKEPLHNLLPEDIILKIPLKQVHLSVDIQKYKIAFPADGVYVGLEWLGEIDNKANFNINPGFSCSREANEFEARASFYGRSFINTLNPKDKYVPMFGIIIN